MGSQPDKVSHNAAQRRFEATAGDSLAVLEYSPLGPTTLNYQHTFVPPAMRGRGVASRLVGFGLDYALEQQLTVVPGCPFVAAYIRRHPRYRVLLGDK